MFTGTSRVYSLASKHCRFFTVRSQERYRLTVPTNFVSLISYQLSLCSKQNGKCNHVCNNARFNNTFVLFLVSFLRNVWCFVSSFCCVRIVRSLRDRSQIKLHRFVGHLIKVRFLFIVEFRIGILADWHRRAVSVALTIATSQQMLWAVMWRICTMNGAHQHHIHMPKNTKNISTVPLTARRQNIYSKVMLCVAH